MQYILIQFDDGQQAYQEIANGIVQRYCDIEGNTLPDFPPTCGAEVIEAKPARLGWMNV